MVANGSIVVEHCCIIYFWISVLILASDKIITKWKLRPKSFCGRHKINSNSGGSVTLNFICEFVKCK